MVVTPEEIIEYNRTWVLDDSAMFRGAGISDLKKHPRTIFLVIYWFFRTHWNDFKTNRFYNSLPTDPAYWIIVGSNPDTVEQYQALYKEWLEDNDIKYRILWYHHFMQYAFCFENTEDVEKFEKRWEWIDRGEYIVQTTSGHTEMFAWLNTNCEGEHRFYSGGKISFQLEIDAVAFKLRWL